MIDEEEIHVIKVEDRQYPELLRKIYDPPKCLYVIGNIEILNNPSIAIVGSRVASEYGKKAAKYFAYNLAKEGFNIVSGLARGIDSFSHIGALDAYGKTVAVIGCGLDIIYPKENKVLEEKIIKNGGTIISEYPLGTPPRKNHFPARNRIISGLSQGVIVIEAKEKSGSLITADFAIEQGREVFAVPGNINSINSIGTNYLIRDGAILINNYKDVLDFIKLWNFEIL